MIRLVSDMQEVFHLDSGKVQVTKDRCPLAKICAEVTIMMQAAAKERGINLERPPEKQAPMVVETDLNFAKSIMSAFVSKAIDYSHEGGWVVIDGQNRGSEIVLFVKEK